MEAIQNLRKQDTKKKNILMLSTYSVSLVATSAYTIIEKEPFYKTMVYVSELSFFILFFLIFQLWLKKESLFPYAAIVAIFIHHFLYIGMFGGNGAFLLVLLFLAVFSAIHFDIKIFVTGYSLGLVAIVMNTMLATENQDFLSSTFTAILLCYVLIGAVLFVLIRLNKVCI